MYRIGKKFSKPTLSRIKNGDLDFASDKAPENPEKFRLDELLQKKHPSFSRATLQKFIASGFVTVSEPIGTESQTENPETEKPEIEYHEPRTVKKPGQKFEKNVKIDLKIPEIDQKSDFQLEILFENEFVKVLNKPAGLLSMKKGEYCPERTLEDFGLLVHRLDRGTSGVVILAKNEKTQSFLRRQFQERKTHKTYLAIVSGCPKLDEANLNLPIARDLKHATRFRVEAGGKPSETYYKVLDTNDKYSLILLKPSTGRTHQLRVHLAYLGTPILGDPVYSDDAEKYPRLFLHAANLEITVPTIAKTDVQKSQPLASTQNPEAPESLQGNLEVPKIVNIRETFTAPLPPEFADFLQKHDLTLPKDQNVF